MICCRPRLEMLNLSQNRLDNIQGLRMLGGLIALNLGTQAPVWFLPIPCSRLSLVWFLSMIGRQSTGVSVEDFPTLMRQSR